MLEMIRNAAKGWAAKVLIALLVASFAVFGIQDAFNGFGSKALATVGDTEISPEQFQRSFDRSLQQFSEQSGQTISMEDARKRGIDKNVLDNLIQGAAVDAQGKSLKLAISDETIAADVANNPTFHDANGKFDPALFKNILQNNNVTPEGFLQSEKENRLRAIVNQSAVAGAVLPKIVTESLFRYRNEQRDARYFSFITAEADVPAPSEDDLKKQYEATPQAYTAPEYRAIAIMKVEPADVAAKVVLTDDEIAAGYEKLKKDYFTPEKRTVLQISFPSLDAATKAKARITAGEDFLKIGLETGAKEADLTFADKLKTDFFDAAIADVAFSLAENAVSEPVAGSLSTALLKVTKIALEKQLTLAEVKTELLPRLQLDRAKEEIQSIYDAVEDGRAAGTKFEDIAAKAGISIEVVPAVSLIGQDRSGKDLTIPQSGELLKSAFNSDVGVENNAISGNDGYFWYEVREVIPSALKPLAEVKAQVTKDFVGGKLRTLASDRAKQLVARAEGGATLDALATELKQTVKTAQGLKRNETSAEFDGLAVIALFGVPENGFTWSLEGDGKTARIMQSQAVLLPTFDPASADAIAIAAEMKQSALQDVLASYVLALKNKAGVVINETLWRQITGTTATP
jgi:peptidyl-prolyl cis-trans isomerase D